MPADISYGSKLGLLNNASIGETYFDELRPFLRGMDALIQAGVVSTTATAPPGSPNDGDAYLLMSGSLTGAWAGKQNKIAVWSTQATQTGTDVLQPAWDYYTPNTGWIVYANDLSTYKQYDGTQWIDFDYLKLHAQHTQVVVTTGFNQVIFAGDPTAAVLITIPLTVDANTGINGNLVVNGTSQLNGTLQVNAASEMTSTVSVASSIASNGDSRFGFATNGDINTASSLNANGGFGAGQRTVTVDTTVQPTDYSVWVDASSASANVNITLPDATSWNAVLVPGNFSSSWTATTTIKVGRMFIIKKLDASANTIVVGTSSSQTIDGNSTVTLTSQFDYVIVQTDGTNWGVVSKTGSGGTFTPPSGTGNKFYATPDGSTGSASLRTIVPADLPVGSSSQLGVLKVDGTTITATSGVISATGSSSSSIDIPSVAVAATSINPLTVQANTVIDLNHFQFADGTDSWSAGPTYSSYGVFIDDFTLSATANPTKFSASQILNIITKFMTHLDGSGNIPSTVYQDGTTTLFYSGSDAHHAYVAGDGWASIPLLMELYYKKTGSLTPYTTYVAAVKTAMALIPRNSGNHLLTVVPGNEYVCGTLFMEYMRSTGDVAWGNVCYVRACKAMLALATAASDATNVTFFTTEVTNVVAGIKSTLIDSGTGMLIAATIQNSANLDIPSSCLAVYMGILTGAQDLAIANYLHTNYSSLVNFAGYILQSPTPWTTIGNILSGGGSPYGSTGHTSSQYQGGYWTFHFAWFCYALAKVNMAQVSTLINTYLTGPDPATEYYDRSTTTPGGTTPNLESPQGPKQAMDMFPTPLTTTAGSAASVNAYGALVNSVSVGGAPLTISGTAGSSFTQTSTTDSTIFVQSSNTAGAGSIGLRDNTNSVKGGFGYANGSFAKTYLQNRCYFYSTTDMVFTAQVGTAPGMTIDAATNGVTCVSTLSVIASGSSTGAFRGTIKASGGAASVIMGELNGVATIGGNNSAFNAWTDFAIQPAGTAAVKIGVVPSTTTPIAKMDNNTGTTTLGKALQMLTAGIFSSFTPTVGSSSSGSDAQWVLAPDGQIYYADPTSHLWTLKAQPTTTPTTTVATSGSAQTIAFASSGNICYDITLSANCTFTLTAPSGSGTYRELILVIRPAGFTATLPASSSGLAWAGGSAPTPSTSSITMLKFGFTGATPVLGGI